MKKELHYFWIPTSDLSYRTAAVREAELCKSPAHPVVLFRNGAPGQKTEEALAELIRRHLPPPKTPAQQIPPADIPSGFDAETPYQESPGGMT